jgi:hypothetical protein
MPFTGERWPGCFCHYSYDAYLFAAHPKNSFPITGRLPTHTAGTEIAHQFYRTAKGLLAIASWPMSSKLISRF